MFSPSKAISRPFRAILLSTAAAGVLNLALGAVAQAGSVPVAANPGNWSHASASTTGSTETVTVTSSRSYAEWSSFNLSAGSTFTVAGQTGPNWILVNRVTGGTGSTLSGNINAGGQVWIIDPNGVTVNAGAVLNVGGLLLSSANWSAADRSNFLSGGTNWNFTGQGSPVVMNGTVVTSGGGVVALLAPSVTVGGTVNAGANTQFAAVAAKDVSLGFSDNGTYFTLSGVTIDRGADGGGVTFNNSSSVSADRIVVAAAGATSAAGIVVGGGLTANAARGDGTDIVLMAADGTGADASPTAQSILSGGAVSPIVTGTTQSAITLGATGSLTAAGVTLASGGEIDLAGDISATNASLSSAEGAIEQTAGTISATSLTGSSAAATSLTTGNAIGTVSNFTSGGDFSLSNAQGLTAGGVTSTGGNVTLQTTAGDITVTGPLTTGAGDTLTLDSYHSISILAPLTVPGAGQVVITTDDGGSGGDYDFGLTPKGFTGSLSFTGGSGSGAGLTINGYAYSLLYSVADLQAVNNVLFGHFALANSLDGTGQTYTDSVLAKLSGTLTGLGHTLDNFTVTSATAYGDVGPIGTNAGTLRDIGVVGGSVTSTASPAGAFVGGLVGGNENGATISQSYATDQVTGSSGSSGGAAIGGLVGSNFFDSTISNSFATGSVSVNGDDGSAGGLVGVNNGSAIVQSFATGAVTATGTAVNAGGLAGINSFDAAIEQSYSTGSASATGTIAEAGGLVGANIFGSTIDQAFATGDVSSSGFAAIAGGLVGLAGSGTSVYTNSYYDYLTTGRASGAQTDGSVGLSTTALQGALPTGFSSAAWGTGPGLYPYLTGFGTPVQAISGFANAGSPGTPASGATITLYTSGAALGAATSGANGYYYYLEQGAAPISTGKLAGTLTLSGASAVSGATYTDSLTSGSVTDFNMTSGTFAIATANPTYSGLQSDLAATFGSTYSTITTQLAGVATAITGTSGSGFTIDQALTTTGNLSLAATGGPIYLDADVSTGNTHTLTFDNAVVLLSDTDLSGSTVKMLSTLDGDHALKISGNAEFDAAVGGGTKLTTVFVSGTTLLDGGSVATSGTQTYDGAVTLGAATILTGSKVSFDSTLNGAYGATISGNAEFDRAVGGITSLASLSVSGTSVLDGGSVTTTGTQTYSGAATLGGSSTFTGSTVSFGSALNGSGVTISGNAVFAGTGGGANLSSLSVSGTSLFDGGSISTTGTQTYSGAATLGANTTFSGSTVTFDSTLDGAYGATISGNAAFDGAVGGVTRLTSLSVSRNTLLDGGSVTTTGTQTYSGAATLGANTTLSGSTVSFDSTLNGAYGATISGNALFDSAVGGVTSLTSLSVSGTSQFRGGVKTTGTQTYSGAAALVANATFTGSKITFGSKLDGNHAVVISGNAEFDGAVGGGNVLASLSVSGTSALDGPSVRTTGTQAYTGAATLGANTTLTGSQVTFGSTLDGAYGATISGNAVFDGAVGAMTSLSSLSVSGTSGLDGGSVTTTGTQTYTGAVTLGAATILTGSLVTFGSTLDGAYAVDISGNAAFDGAVGGGTSLSSLLVSGSSALGGSVTTTGTQTYSGAATLTADATLTGFKITFQSTLDGAHAATLTGNAEFDGAVGGSTALSSLGVSGTSLLAGGSVTTTGTQTYSGAVTLGAATTLTGSTVTFGSTLDGAYGTTISGNAAFDGAVGGLTSLASLSVAGTSALGGSVTTTGMQTYSGAAMLTADSTLTGSKITFQSTLDGAHAATISGNAEFDGAVGGSTALSSLGVSGTSLLEGGPVTTTGTQTYSGAATLGAATTLTGSTVIFGSTLDGAYGTTISGNAAFDGAVGGLTSLSSLSVSGTSALGGSVTTTGTQTYSGAATLGADTTWTGSKITFQSTLDGAHAATISGNAEFDAAVGGSTALSSLSVSGTSLLDGGSVTTTGAQTYSGAATLGAATTLTGSTIGFGSTLDGAYGLTIAGNAAFDGAVGGGTSLASLSVSGTSLDGAWVTTAGAQTYAGAATLTADSTFTGSKITFQSTLNGAHAAKITGNAEFDGAVGGTAPLSSLSVLGTSQLDGGSVTTAGTQTYSGAATLGAATSLTGSTITFGSTLDGADAATISGNAVFDGAVGEVTSLASLSVSGTSWLDGGSVMTTGTQTYSGAAMLGVYTTFTGPEVTFGSTLDGFYGAAISGNAVFDGAVGGAAPLSSLLVSSTSLLDGGSVKTTGMQTYWGAATLGANTTFTGSEVTFGSTLDGAHAATISGNAAFDGAVGGTTALTSLSVSGTSWLDGGSVTTTGTQTYSGATTLGADSTFTGSTITFGATLDGARAATISGNAAFDGAVGGAASLSSLSVSGTSLFDGGSVSTTGTQTYTGAATLGADSTLTGSQVTLASTVNGPHALDITASGGVSFLASIGGAMPLSGLAVTGSQVALPNSVTTGSGGLSITTTQGDLTINQALSTTGNLSLAAKGGNLTFATPMTFTGSSGITLDAYGSVFINVPITIAGSGAASITTNDGGTGGDYDFGLSSSGFTSSLSFTGTPHSGQSLTINGSPYTLVYSMSDVAGIAGNMSGDYALAESVNASGTTYANAVVNGGGTSFSGVFAGLGHTISNLKIVAPSTDDIGLFAAVNGATVRDVGLIGGSVSGGSTVGELAGNASNATLLNVFATGSVSGTGYVGGLVGDLSTGSLSHAYATGSVTGQNETGGLVGENGGTVSNAYATGSVTGVNTTGGLAGLNDGSITNAYATGAVVGQNNGTGGLIGSGYGSLTDVYATGFVMGQNSTGGLIGYNDGGSVNAGYYDSQTTGHASGTQSDGSVGMTTAQLQGTLRTGFSSSAWGTGAGLYPYLNWQYATTPEAVTGTAVSLYPTAPLTGASVNVYTNGGDVGAGTTGANGYYYVLVAGNTIKSNTPFGTTLTLAGDSGVDAITYSDTQLASATGVTNVNTVLGRNYVSVSDPTLSALFAGMGTAFGPSEMAYLKTTPAFTYQDLNTSAPIFTIDQAVDVTSVFKVTAYTRYGTVIDAAPITVESGATLMWTANGALQINAPISVKGSGEINLHYDYYQTSSGGVADPTAFSFGNGGSVSYLTSSGGVATSQQGGQFVLNNSEYTLIYTLSQLDSIDGINGVTGASEYVSGPGITGNYALANTLNAAGTTYGRELVNNFEGTFEGLNNSIDNLTIKDNGATSDAVGLFGALHGTARDINLVNVSMTDTDPHDYHPAMGGLAGYSDGSLYNVSVSGDVNASNDPNANVGGVIGYAPNGTVYDVRASDTVEGAQGDTLGDLVGLSYAATISQSWATGNVTGTHAIMGGLVGFAEGGTTISQSYATGNISGGTNSAEGGLVGDNQGAINQTYAAGNVTATSLSTLGGLVGVNSGTVKTSYWNTNTSGQTTSAGGSKLTTAQLQSGTLPAGFSPAIWSVTPGQYPKLKVAGQ